MLQKIGTGVVMLESHLKSISLNEAGASPAGSSSAAGDAERGNWEKAMMPTTRTERGGRVKHDSRGNAVWDWGVATGIFAGIKSAELLSMLDNPTLSLEGEPRCNSAGDWAGDPYNRR